MAPLLRGVDIAPVLQAIAIDPGNHVVILGRLTVDERKRLVAELRGPLGAPDAGIGGASPRGGVDERWVAAGVGFLVLAGLLTLALRRRSG